MISEILLHLPVILVALALVVVVWIVFRPSHGRVKPVVFLSSTSEFADLHPKLEAWIRGLGKYDPWSYLNRDATEHLIEETIRLSRFFVLVLGRTFGTEWKESGRSIVQREFELALAELPPHAVRPFLRKPPSGPVDPKQNSFIESIRGFGSEIASSDWDTEERLRIQVAEGLSRAQQRYEELHVESTRRLNRFVFLPLLLVTGALAAFSYYDWGPALATQRITFGALGVVALAAAGFNIFHNQEQ